MEMGRKSESSWICCGTSLSNSVKSETWRPLMNRPEVSVTEVGATTRRTGTLNFGSWAKTTAESNMAQAIVRAAPAIVAAPGILSQCSQECEHGTRECVRHQLCGGKQDTKSCASQLAGDQHDISARQDSALAGYGQSQSHASSLERDGRFEQGRTGSRVDTGARVMHFDRNHAARRRGHTQHDAAWLNCLGGVFQQVRQHTFYQIFVGVDFGAIRREPRVVDHIGMGCFEQRDAFLE